MTLGQQPRRALFVTGSRGEWGYIRPVLERISDRPDVVYEICATNMHLLPSHGSTEGDILADGFEIRWRIPMAIEGGNHLAQAKSIGVLTMGLCDVVASSPPDWIVLAGDRGEQLAGAIVGAFANIPILHIQAGELSGNVDGMTRHAIGKYANIHCASNDDAGQRLARLGEEEWRIHVTGAPQLDDLVAGRLPSREELVSRLGRGVSGPFALVVQHGVTDEFIEAGSQVETLMRVLAGLPLNKVVILPNNDPGSLSVRQGIERYRDDRFYLFANVPRPDYLALLRDAEFLIGNSSSGILEAPSFGTPVVNVGSRQDGRLQAQNVVNADFTPQSLSQAIDRALSADFRYTTSECINPYGDGHASVRIADLLARIPIDDRLLRKRMTH